MKSVSRIAIVSSAVTIIYIIYYLLNIDMIDATYSIYPGIIFSLLCVPIFLLSVSYLITRGVRSKSGHSLALSRKLPLLVLSIGYLIILILLFYLLYSGVLPPYLTTLLWNIKPLFPLFSTAIGISLAF